MTESIKLMKLDLMITKNYWREILFAGFIFTISILPNFPLALNVILFIAGNVLLGYPFMVAEKDRMDKFYSIIAITRREFVKGKYMMAWAYMLLIGLILIPLNLLIYYGMKVEMNFLFVISLISVGVLFYSLVATIQIPCYLKWGYAKAKMITTALPVLIGLGVPIVVIGGKKLLGTEKMIALGRVFIEGMIQNVGLVMIGFIGIIILSYYISYSISKRIYK